MTAESEYFSAKLGDVPMIDIDERLRNAVAEIERLRKELAECKQDRSITLGAMCVIDGRCLSGELYAQLATVTAERDELVEALAYGNRSIFMQRIKQ